MATKRTTRPSGNQDNIVSDEYVASAAVPDPSGARMADMAPFIWQQLGEIQNKLGAIETKQDNLTDRLQRVEDKAGTLSDKVGRFIWGVAGAGILITVVLGVSRLIPIKIAFEDVSRKEAVAASEVRPGSNSPE